MVSTLLESTMEIKKDSETDRQRSRQKGAKRWLQHTYRHTQIPGNNNSYFCSHDCKPFNQYQMKGDGEEYINMQSDTYPQ